MKKLLLAAVALIFFTGCGGGVSSDVQDAVDTNTSTVQNTPQNALVYLNTLRSKAGMIEFTENRYLDSAAQNHANYLYINNATGHYEDENLPGYTGYSPVDRALYAGYLSKFVSENVSAGESDYTGSVDDLFSAIYHRFGFLNTDTDTIGIGINTDRYVYDMGNSGLNTLCAYEHYDGGSYYIDVCADENIKIGVDYYGGEINTTRSKNPDVIIWPYDGAENIPPAFYEEYPDPLPDYGVSGYPLSIQFNRYYFPGDVSLESFSLYNEEGNEITDVRLLDSASDPNQEIDDHEFALFPLQRLEWGESYRVVAVYEYNGVEYTKEWSFKTKELEYPYYKITTADETIYVDSGEYYGYYFVPLDADDVIYNYSYTYPQGDSVDIKKVDANTYYIKLTGSSGDVFEFSFNDGERKLTLIIK